MHARKRQEERMEETVVVFSGSLNDVKEVSRLLEREGIGFERFNPSCTTSS